MTYFVLYSYTYIWLCQRNQNNVLQKEIKDLIFEVCNLSTYFLFFKSFPIRDHTFMTSTRKVESRWGGGVLKFATSLRINRSIVHFCGWEVGWRSKNCFFVNFIIWPLTLKVTSIKRNVFSFSFIAFQVYAFTRILKIKFFSRE